MPAIYYPISRSYRVVPGLGLQPAIELELIHGSTSRQVVGILDSGAMLTVFSSEIAGFLGIEEVAQGEQVNVSTLGGTFRLYQFDLDIRFPIDGECFAGRVGFATTHLSRNILGRNLLFSRFEISFRERQQQIHLRPED
jgi:hypothetical protein